MKTNDPKTQVILDYSHLGDEETEAGQICPACNGGASQEGSFSVTRRGGFLLYNCHRSSCGFGGRSYIAGGAWSTGKSGGNEGRSRPYISTVPLSPATAKLLADRYYIGRQVMESARLGWTGDDSGRYSRRVSFPILDPMGKQRGTNYRSYENAKPKALIELAYPDAVAMAWYRTRPTSKTVVLVEDQVSALKLSPYFHTAALLGTHISDSKADEILAQKYENVFLSLDNDATFDAIKQQLKWKNRIPHMYVIGIEKDIKDMNPKEFYEYLQRVKK